MLDCKYFVIERKSLVGRGPELSDLDVGTEIEAGSLPRRRIERELARFPIGAARQSDSTYATAPC